MLHRGGYTANAVRALSLLSTTILAQEEVESGYYEPYFADSLTFELDLQEHDDPNNNSNNLNLKRVFNFDSSNPTATQVQEEVCQGQKVPPDQCMWIDQNVRVFHQGEVSEGIFTGNIEITLKNPETGETWECYGGKYTEEADASEGQISYYDQPIPEGYYLYDFGYEWQQQSNVQEPDHTAPNYSVSSLGFKFRALDGQSGDIGFVYVPEYIFSAPRYSAQWTINPNLYDLNPAKRLLATKLWHLQVAKGQTEETVPISSPNDVGMPLSELANPYYLKYIQTLVVFTDGGTADEVKAFGWTPTQIADGVETFIQTINVQGGQSQADRTFIPPMPMPIKCGHRDIWQYASDIETHLLDQTVLSSEQPWNYKVSAQLYPDTFWPTSDFIQKQTTPGQFSLSVQNFGFSNELINWRHPLQVKLSLGAFDPFYYKLDLQILGECTNLITMINKYAYQTSEKPTEAILLNRPGSERKINLTPYFKDVKEDTSMTVTPSCGDIEYVLMGKTAGEGTEAASPMYDFVEVIDSELVVYCDWYTKETGTFEVNVAARLKWFATEMSEPVTFKITLNENCNKASAGGASSSTATATEAALSSVIDQSSDRVFSYGEIVLVLGLFLVSTMIGAGIAYLFIGPVRASYSGAKNVAQAGGARPGGGHQQLETNENVTVTGANISQLQ